MKRRNLFKAILAAPFAPFLPKAAAAPVTCVKGDFASYIAITKGVKFTKFPNGILRDLNVEIICDPFTDEENREWDRRLIEEAEEKADPANWWKQ